METTQVLRAADRKATPWKNGGGVTREIAASPAGAGLETFDWRVSLADVAKGGPFSSFPGVDRVITVVEGPGMALTVDGVTYELADRFRPFAFPGDAVTNCRLLGGAIVDFNVMTRRDSVSARVGIVREARTELPGATAGPAAGTTTTLVVVLDGTATLPALGVTLTRLDALLLKPDAFAPPQPLTVSGTTAVVTFEPLDIGPR
jgi:environmental stress-induced protein Ves